MSTKYMDWADWAGDHMLVCEDLRDEANCGGNCEHAEINSIGCCDDCGEPYADFEPDDAQLLTQSGTKEPAA